jgi:hypothetical protein
MPLQLANIERLHLVLLLAVSAVAFLTRWLSPGSVLLGGAVMGGNVWLMRQLFRRLLTPAGSNQTAAVLAIILLKFSLFMGLLALLLWRVPVDPLGLGVGATLLLIASVAEAVRHQPVSA